MHINPVQLLRCLDKVQEIDEQYRAYHLAADDPYRSIPKLKDTIERYLQVKVELLELEVHSTESVVQGAFIMRNSKEFDIVVASGLVDEWQRFIVCKELFHILLDQESFRDMDLEGHIEAITAAFPNDDSRPRLAVVVEFLAEVAAMEFLFPRARRVEAIAQAANTRELAERYGIPLVFAERYLSDSFISQLDRAHIEGLT